MERDTEILLFSTTSSREEAERIAMVLVERKLVACVNIVPQIVSIFSWQNAISKEQEVLLMMKSKAALFDEIAKAVRETHSYSVPELIAVPIVKGLPEYIAWIHDVTKQ